MEETIISIVSCRIVASDHPSWIGTSLYTRETRIEIPLWMCGSEITDRLTVNQFDLVPVYHI